MAANTGLVLCYDPSGAALRARGAFARQRVRIRTVTPEQLGERVGKLAGLRGWETAEPEAATAAFEGSVLVFSGLAGPRLDGVLAALRRAGVGREVYRAVVTGDNAGWSFSALCAELARERAAVEQGVRADHGEGGNG